MTIYPERYIKLNPLIEEILVNINMTIICCIPLAVRDKTNYIVETSLLFFMHYFITNETLKLPNTSANSSYQYYEIERKQQNEK